MPNRVQAQRIICRGGLNTNENYLKLSNIEPGAATRLVNFETSQRGGYRRINGYVKYDSDFPEVTEAIPTAEGPVLGVWAFFNTSTRDVELIAARKDIGTDTYSFYFNNLNVGWFKYTTGITHSTVDPTTGTEVFKVRSEQFNFGDVNVIAFVDGVNNLVVYDGTTWYEISSAGAGTPLSPGGPQIVDKPSYITSFYGHLFVSGDEDTPGVIAHSAPRDFLDWTSGNGAGQLIYGYPVVNLKPWRNQLFIFGETSIKQAKPDVSAGFLLEDVTTNVGCVAPDSIQEIAGNLVFLSREGIRPIAGTEKIGDVELSLLSQYISLDVQDIVENKDLRFLNSLTIRGKQQFRYFFSDETTEKIDSEGLIGCLRIDEQGPEWEFMTLMGIRTSTAWSGIVEQDEYVLFGDYDGNVYSLEQGSTFDGVDITAIFTTPYLDMGDTETRKLMRKLNTFVDAEGSVDFNISVRFDWGDTDVLNPPNYTGQTVAGPITYGGGAEYDDGSVYGGARRDVIHTNIQGSCFSVQFSYVTEGHAPYTIFGYVTEFSAKGKE